MPVIHAPLNDEDFVDLAIMAREKGMTRSALASHILIAAIRKDERMTIENESTEFNSQAPPLVKKSALASVILTAAMRREAKEHEEKIQTMSKDGTPRIPMYERQ